MAEEYDISTLRGRLAQQAEPDEPPADATDTVDETPADPAPVDDIDEIDDDLDVTSDEEEPPEQRQRPPRSERRIKQLNTQKNQALQQAQREREERIRLEARLQALEQGQQPAASQPTQPQSPPEPDDFDTHDEYVRASARYEAHQIIEAERQQQQATKQVTDAQDAQQQLRTAFNQSVEVASTKYEDFDELTESTPVGSNVLQYAIAHSDDPGELLYYFGQHHDEVERLNGITDGRRMLREIGRIEARVLPTDTDETDPKPSPTPRPPRSNAPTPLTPPVGDRSAASATKDPDKMNFQEYKAWKKTQRGG